jgi:hypothetical protein
MTFGLSPHNLPNAYSYDAALALYERSERQDDHWRALCRKSDTSKRIALNGPQVIFRYHHTDLVKWNSRTQLEIALYATKSSRVFSNQFVPHGVGVQTLHGYDCVSTRAGSFVGGANRIVVNFIRDEWVVHLDQDFKQFHSYKTDAKINAEVRKRLKPFLEYREALARLQQRKRVLRDSRVDPRGLQCIWDALPRKESWPALYENLSATDNALRLSLLGYLGGIVKVPEPIGVIPRESSLARFI